MPEEPHGILHLNVTSKANNIILLSVVTWEPRHPVAAGVCRFRSETPPLLIHLTTRRRQSLAIWNPQLARKADSSSK